MSGKRDDSTRGGVVASESDEMSGVIQKVRGWDFNSNLPVHISEHFSTEIGG